MSRAIPTMSSRRTIQGVLVAATVAAISGCTSIWYLPKGHLDDPEVQAAAAEAKRVARSAKMISADEARDLGYRIDWMNGHLGEDIYLPSVQAGSVLLFTGEDHLVRIDSETGRRRWSSPIGNRVFEIFGATYLPAAGQIFVTADGAIFAVDAATGDPVSEHSALRGTSDKPVQKLRWPSATPSTVVGDYLVYGSRSGEVVWHAWSIGFTWRTYRVSGALRVQPLLSEGIIIAAGADGAISAIDARDVDAVWSLQLLDAVVAQPAVAGNTVFIAGSDQYLRAVNLDDGSLRWKTLTTAPLLESPVIHGDHLFIQVPGEGLACFSAFPTRISGERLWTTEEVVGSILTTTVDGRLLTWSQEQRLLQIVEPAGGYLVSTLHLPGVRTLMADADRGGNLYMLLESDAIFRLVPRR